MTPERYILELEALAAKEQWALALAFANASVNDVSPPLSAAELDRVQGLLEIAANIAQLSASGDTRRDDQFLRVTD